MASASGVLNTGERVQPVFVQQRSLPADTQKPYSVHEICGACEKKSGHGSIIGAQQLGALWRIYPQNNQARVKLLISGISLRGYSVTLGDKNPFVIQTANGEEEVKTTKLIIGNLPISFSNKEIEDMITKLGGKPRSKLFMERDRDDMGGLTRWLTGRRFIYVEVPPRPFPTRVELGPFKPTLYHFEQKASKPSQCGRCLQPGHVAANCDSEIVCLACKKPGHKKGSALCQDIHNTPPHSVTLPSPSKDIHNTPPDSVCLPPPSKDFRYTPFRSVSMPRPSNPSSQTGLKHSTDHVASPRPAPCSSPSRKSRSKTRQDTLPFRPRDSSSSKRARSPVSSSPRQSPSQQQDKYRRLTVTSDGTTSPSSIMSTDVTKQQNFDTRSAAVAHSGSSPT